MGYAPPTADYVIKSAEALSEIERPYLYSKLEGTVAMSGEDPPANGGGTRPGIVVRPPCPGTLFKDTDLDLLESRLETKVGEGKVKKIELSKDKMEFYVELNDTAGTVG